MSFSPDVAVAVAEAGSATSPADTAAGAAAVVVVVVVVVVFVVVLLPLPLLLLPVSLALGLGALGPPALAFFCCCGFDDMIVSGSIEERVDMAGLLAACALGSLVGLVSLGHTQYFDSTRLGLGDATRKVSERVVWAG